MSIEDPMFRDMQEYNRERDERDNERADRKHRENPPAEPKCERCSPTCRFEGRADDHLRYSRGFGQGSDIGRCSDDEECECDGYRPPTPEPAESEGKAE